MKAVVFDLDDTLFPERTYAFSGFAAVARKFAAQLGDVLTTMKAMERLFDTEHRPRVFNALLDERGIPESPDLIRSMIDAYRQHRPVISLYPDADAALDRLVSDCALGIITDGPAVQQSAKLDALALRDRVDVVILTEELGQGCCKPSPAAFELMATTLEADHEDCVYVADNPTKDFVAPNALGWTTIRVVRQEGIYKDAPTATGGEARQVIDSLEILDNAIFGIERT